MSHFFNKLILAAESDAQGIDGKVDDLLRSTDGEQTKSPETHPELMETGDTTVVDLVDESICEEAQDLEDAVGDLVAAQSDVELVESAAEIVGATDAKAETLVTRAATESFHNILNLMRERYDISGDGVVIGKESAISDVRPMLAAEASEVLGKMKTKALNAWNKLIEWLEGLWDKFFTSTGRRVTLLTRLKIEAKGDKYKGNSRAPQGSFQSSILTIKGNVAAPTAAGMELGHIADNLGKLAERAKKIDQIVSQHDVSSFDLNPNMLGGVSMSYPTAGAESDTAVVEVGFGSASDIVNAADSCIKAIETMARHQKSIKFNLGVMRRMVRAFERDLGGVKFTQTKGDEGAGYSEVLRLKRGAASAFLKITARAVGLAQRVSSDTYKWGQASLRAIDGGAEPVKGTPIEIDQITGNGNNAKSDNFRFRGQGRFAKNDVSDVEVK